jgi:mycoredoxin
MTEKKMIVYGHDFCPPARSLVRSLNKHGVDYEYRDILKGDPHWKKEVEKLADGYQSVPTIVFPNGDVFVEPPRQLILEALGIHEPGIFDRLFNFLSKKEEPRADED